MYKDLHSKLKFDFVVAAFLIAINNWPTSLQITHNLKGIRTNCVAVPLICEETFQIMLFYPNIHLGSSLIPDTVKATVKPIAYFLRELEFRYKKLNTYINSFFEFYPS